MPPSPYSHLLKTRDNQVHKLDFLTTHELTLPDGGHLQLLYIADKLILLADSLADYCATHPDQWTESHLVALLTDINNEVIPRWLRLRYKAADTCHTTLLIEDSQPGWNHPEILARIPLL